MCIPFTGVYLCFATFFGFLQGFDRILEAADNFLGIGWFRACFGGS